MDRRNANTSRGPNEFVRAAAQAYNDKHGLRRIVEGLYVAVDVRWARRIADAYTSLPIDDSGNPAVHKAYQQLGEEIEQQWKFAIDAMGMRLEPWKSAGQPYANSAEMCRDVRNHRHLYFTRVAIPIPS